MNEVTKSTVQCRWST